jgi:hypothetical protein
MTSCDPVKRHARLVEKFPHVHQQDTIIVRDTIRAFIPKVTTDTIVHVNTLRDTLYVEKDRFRVRIHTIHDSVFVEGECKEIIVEKVVERKIPIVYYKGRKDNGWIKKLIVFCIVGFTLYSIINRKKEK